MKKLKSTNTRSIALECLNVANEFENLLPKNQRPVPYISAHFPELATTKQEKEKIYRFFEYGKPNDAILVAVKKAIRDLKRESKKKAA
jgi:hypothetical protein